MNSRADTVALLLFIAVALVIPAAVIAQHFFGVDILSALRLGPVRLYVGIGFAALAILITLLNVYLSFVAPWLHYREHGDMQDYSHMSGFPVIAGLFVLFAGVLVPSSPPVGVVLLITYLADTGGLPWFLFSVWRQRDA